jgi:hypothetical protein
MEFLLICKVEELDHQGRHKDNLLGNLKENYQKVARLQILKMYLDYL